MTIVDEPRVKRDFLQPMWLQGGGDSLVKVMEFGRIPDPARMIGYCTKLIFLIGRTPLDIERNVGFRENSKLVAGAEVFLVDPLPAPDDYDLAGYSNTPEGISTSIKPAHVDYPPGRGVPQWNLARFSQKNLVHLATLLPGQPLRLMFDRLPRPTPPRPN